MVTDRYLDVAHKQFRDRSTEYQQSDMLRSSAVTRGRCERSAIPRVLRPDYFGNLVSQHGRTWADFRRLLNTIFQFQGAAGAPEVRSATQLYREITSVSPVPAYRGSRFTIGKAQPVAIMLCNLNLVFAAHVAFDHLV
jgi:hypothetical protein